jgi:VCBS repeat-containing protein
MNIMKIMGKSSNRTTIPNRAQQSPRGTIRFGYALISLNLAILISINWFSVGLAQDTALTKKKSPRSGLWPPAIQTSIGFAESPGETTLDVRIANSTDDAEERVDGSVSRSSSDLEMVFDSGGDQVVGMRFNGINIPPGAIITNAFIQFQVDETPSAATSLVIHGEAADNPLTFTSANWNISSRPKTSASVAWSPVAWNTRGEAGVDQQTPDISRVIQEIVDRPGWVPNNSLAIIITGTGERVAESYNGDQAAAPLLHIEFLGGNTPQVAISSPTDGDSFNQGNEVGFTASASDIEDGDLTAVISWESNIDGFMGTGGDIQFAYLSLGEHTITASAIDSSNLIGSDQVNISVTDQGGNLPPVVSAGADQTVSLYENATLDGTISDDGLPIPPGSVAASWSMLSGPGVVTFSDPSAEDTTASFSSEGTYVMQLTADDGELTASDQVTIIVLPASIIEVPQDQPSIQAGIDAAQNGDLVLVSPGTYYESFTISGKNIILASLFYTTQDPNYIDQTILDGSGQTVITYLGALEATTKIIGFTIQNGLDGISADGKIDILNNRFTSNEDAIDYEGGSSICRDNLFEFNSDDAVDLDGDTEAIIEGNIIRNNNDDGIEIRLHDYTGPLLNIIIRNNIISSNGEDGIQLIDYPGLSDRYFLIEYNLFEANAMVGLGMMDDGVTKEDYRAASIPEPIHLFNNTFSGHDHALTGGNNLVALNNLFVNSTNIGLKGVDGNSIAAYNLFWNNGNDIQTSNVDTNSTLFDDPLLDVNYQLQLGSPAIDAGTDFFEWQGETVLDIPGNEYFGMAPDIGLNESNHNQIPSVDAGENQEILLPKSAFLSGMVTDDGLPHPPMMNTTWTKVSGPGDVKFSDASAVDTTVSFSSNGIYVLRLTANDGEFTASDELTIKVILRFVSWGDTKSARNRLAALSNQAVLLDPALTIYAGDLEENGFTLAGMDAWKDAMNGYADSGMFDKTFPVRGNHDSNDQAGWQSYYDLGSTAQNLGASYFSALAEDLTYSFDYGNAHIIGVDVLGSAGNLTSEQVNWIDNDLSDAEARGLTHAFVYFHGPIYCVDGHCSCTARVCSIPSKVVDLINVINQHPIVSATFHGHEHTYAYVHLDDSRIPEITRPFEQFITGAAGAGSSDCIPGRTDYCMPAYGFVTVDVWDNNFTVNFYQLDITAPVNSMTFSKSGNQAPFVDAGPDQIVTLPDAAILDGTATDDGLPNPPGALITTWSLTGGPGNVTFNDSSALNPAANFSLAGDYVLRLTANDGELITFDEVAITVNANNNPPGPGDDLYSTNEDQNLSIAAPGMLTNDSDPDGDPLTITTTPITPPSSGSLSLNSDGSFSYTPNPNFNGDDNFVYKVCDDSQLCTTAKVTLIVNPINDPPMATNDTGTVNQGGTLLKVTPGVLGNDSDPEEDSLAVTTTPITPPSYGSLSLNSDGSYTYIHNGSPVTSDSFVYQVCDSEPLCDIATVNISITSSTQIVFEVRVAASSDDAEEKNSSGRVVLTSSDLELVRESEIQSVGIRFNGVNIPQGANITSAYIQFQADETNSEATTLIIHGQAIGNAPTFINSTNNITNRELTVANITWSPDPWTIRGEAGPSQESADIASIIREIVELPGWSPGNSLVILITGTGKRVAESYNGEQAGAPLLHVEYITGPPNEPPEANDDVDSVAEGGILSISPPGVLTNDSDPEENPLTVTTSPITPPLFGSLTLNTDGSFTYIHDGSETISDSFVYEVCDTGPLCTTAIVAITIMPVNDAPIADANGPYSGGIGAQIDFDGSRSSDVDGTIVSYDWDFGDGNFGSGSNPTHTYAGEGNYTIELTVTDDGGKNATDNTSANIQLVPNNPPDATDDPYATDEDKPLTITAPGVLTNDNDPDGDPMTVTTTPISPPNNGSVMLNADGSFSYTPDPGFRGDDSFVYEVCDDGPLCSIATVTIDVQALSTSFSVIYITSTSGGNVGGISFKDEDILTFDLDTAAWSMYFDGSDVGLDAATQEIDAMHIESDGSILLSLGVAGTVPDVGSVDDFDILRFIPTALGDTTIGTFELYFDGSDVELDAIGEDIDAIGFSPGGDLIISTRGYYGVGNFNGGDEDLLAFSANTLGANTSGSWAMYFDGSDVGLEDGANDEDVSATWINNNGDIYLATRGPNSVPGATGDSDDILTCIPGSLGDTTTCGYSLYWDGSVHGFGGEVFSGLALRP